jgi:hypothetical protein
LGDEVVAVLSDSGWDLVTVEDAGHDGWDNSITVDDSGNWHTAAVDPSQFGGQSGVEYATNAGGSISVVEVGSGPIVYEFATSIQLTRTICQEWPITTTMFKDWPTQNLMAAIGE